MGSSVKKLKGFSLIELMVVVSIIGIITVIASANYQTYRRNAVSTEAKTLLASLYSTEVAFHTLYESYTTRLDALGFNPAGTLNWSVGFLVEYSPPNPGIPQGSVGCRQTCPSAGISNCSMPAWACSAKASVDVAANIPATAANTAFLAGAHIHHDGSFPFSKDAQSFSIDDQKQITEVFPAN